MQSSAAVEEKPFLLILYLTANTISQKQGKYGKYGKQEASEITHSPLLLIPKDIPKS